DAWIIYDELEDEEKSTLKKLVDNLTQKLTVATQIQCSEQLHQRTFDYGNETLLTYQNDVKRLAHRAYPDLQENQLKPIVLMAFIRGLRGHSVSLARKVRNANPKSLQVALQKAQFIMSDPFIDEPEHSEQDVLQHELAAVNGTEQYSPCDQSASSTPPTPTEVLPEL
ncbi:paraneoplastic Ma antigen, partial [Perkinsus chesapeaki]